jgi:hypothetical protein
MYLTGHPVFPIKLKALSNSCKGLGQKDRGTQWNHTKVEKGGKKDSFPDKTDKTGLKLCHPFLPTLHSWVILPLLIIASIFY